MPAKRSGDVVTLNIKLIGSVLGILVVLFGAISGWFRLSSRVDAQETATHENDQQLGEVESKTEANTQAIVNLTNKVENISQSMATIQKQQDEFQDKTEISLDSVDDRFDEQKDMLNRQQGSIDRQEMKLDSILEYMKAKK